MLPVPPPPTEFEEGRVFEYSDVGQSLWRLQQAGQLTDGHAATSDGVALPVHRAVLAARGAEVLLADAGGRGPLDGAQLASLIALVYKVRSRLSLGLVIGIDMTGLVWSSLVSHLLSPQGHVGEALLQGAQASREVLERDTQELLHVLRGARVAGLPLFARDAQRSVITRIGRGGPAAPDGFNPDLEVGVVLVLVFATDRIRISCWRV